MSDGFYEQVAIWSQVVGAVAFLAVLVFLWIRFLAPAVAASQVRKNAELSDAERRRDGAKEHVAEAERELTRATGEAGSISTRAEGDAQRLRERILAEAKAECERLLRNAEGELGRGRTAARETLREELLTKALQMARVDLLVHPAGGLARHLQRFRQ